LHWNEIIDLSRKSIKANKLRTRITIAIIALGITALVGIVTAISCLNNSISTSFSSMGANTFTLQPYNGSKEKKHKPGRRHKILQTSKRALISYNQALEYKKRYTFPSIVSMHVAISRSSVVRKGSKKSNPNVWLSGVDQNYLAISGSVLKAGRNFNAQENFSGTNVCILGNGIAKKYFKTASLAVNNIIQIDERKYRIVGVLDKKGSSFVDRTDNSVWRTLQNSRLTGASNGISVLISTKVNDVKQLQFATSEAEGLMRSVRKIQLNQESDFEIQKSDSIAAKLTENLKYIAMAAFLIGIITLLGAAIGLMNIMLVAVAERTKEIGLSKAIGATSQTIKRQFLTESVIISLFGGIWGTCIGIIVGNVVSIFLKSSFYIPWLWIGIAFVICCIVGLASGVYPALKASKLNPINALRYE
jgi:putative ABC transport system permease protein